MRNVVSKRNTLQKLTWGAAVCLPLLLGASPAMGQVAAGYSEYYIPGDEVTMWTIFDTLDDANAGGDITMHAVISVTAWSANTTVYYDHWEDGYDFSPANPSTADETYTLATAGAQRTFESANIPTTPRGTATYYDGGDRIYVAGGVVTVTRASWIEGVGVGNQSAAWEIYPVKPQLTTYVMPFGENLPFVDFGRVFALIQATADNTTFTVDLNGDGVADLINVNRNANKTVPDGDLTTVTLQRGQTFLLDRISACPSGANCLTTPGTLNSGTVIQGSKTLQVKFVAGNPGQTYCARGLSAFPRGFWTTDYYAPLDQPTTAGRGNTDYYLYNPGTSAITIDWQSGSSSGFFSIPGSAVGGTVSFRTATVGSVPVDSGLYFKERTGSNPFWGVGIGNALGASYEWGYSLLPSTFLFKEHFLGWAPGSIPVDTAGNPGNQNDDGVFLSVAQDNTRVFVDFNNDGVADSIDADGDGTAESPYITLNRLQTQFFYDPTNAAGGGDLSQAHFWATGPFTMAYGENADTANTTTPSLDLGYVAIPGTDFIALVLTVDKTVSPEVVPTASGSVATFTIKVNSQKYTVNGINVTDFLPPNWGYVVGTDTTTITRPDKSQLTGAAADPAGAGTLTTLAWSSAQLGPNMAESQEITITFTARTTAVLAAGTLSRNRVQAVGTRTVAGATQTFTTTDFAYVTTGDLQIAKASSVAATTPLYPGDRFTYTVTVTNPASGVTLTGVSLYDALPAGVTPVAGTTSLSLSSVADNFNTLPVSYANDDGTRTWNGPWTEVDSGGGGSGGAAGGYIQVTGGELRLNNDDDQAEKSVARGVDLTGSGAAWATLTYDYRTSNNLEAGDVMNVQYRLGGGGGWTTLATYSDDVSGTATLNIPIASPANLTEIRFAILSTTAYGRATEFFYVDNLVIVYDQSVTDGNPPTIFSSYTLPATRSLTATFDVTVDNPLASGITALTNTASATSTQLPIQVSASVSNLVVNPSVLSASVAGRVWFDGDGDAAQDIGEPGIANVEVTLKDRFGTPVATTITDASGRYLFAGVEPGTGYYVEITDFLPAGLTQTAPVGRTDDRTNAFDLAAGQSYSGADLGYRSDSAFATFGDLVWADPNTSQLRESGEVGIGPVTVELWLDTNGDGVINDTLYRSTTTAPDGSYLFTEVPASGTDYILAVVPPAGYTATTDTTRAYPDVAGGSVILTGDFGFTKGGLLTIRDRVWQDTDGDGVFGAGESGVAGVTVELLNASLKVIGTTTTAADGTFTFSGVDGGGADYTVRINDTGGVLIDFVGTTSYAIARQRAESNLSASIDRVTTPPPSYGFRPTRTIGDTIFRDVDADGVQDPGEGGFTGVSVRLYRDLNNDGVIDAGEPLVGTVATDASGQYLFAGLANGPYIVSVPPPAGYTFSGPGSDTDPAAGIQKTATMAGSNILDRDFGFRADPPRALAGTIWEDQNADGVIDASEARLAGVSLDVYNDLDGDGVIDVGEPIVSAITTDAAGAYSVAGLASVASGRYIVQVTDTNGALTGYAPTYEKAEGLTSPFNYQEAVDLTAGDATDVHFGYGRPVLTYASVADLRAYRSDGAVVVEWRTSHEAGTAGFHLFRLDPATNGWTRLNDRLLPGLVVHPEGGTYRFLDSTAPAEDALVYRLVEKDVRGAEREYGPYSVRVAAEGPPSTSNAPRDLGRSGFNRRPTAFSPARRTLARAATAARQAAADLGATRRTSVLKVTTREAGLHYLAAPQLASSSGLAPELVSQLIGRNALKFTNRGRVVPWLPDAGGAGVYFYAQAEDGIYTADNAFRVSFASARPMGTVASAPAGILATSFQETAHSEEDQFPLLIDTHDLQSDFWFWEYLFAGYDGFDAKTLTVRAPGALGTGAARLVVHLMGGTEAGVPGEHHVTVSFNGSALGGVTWDGITRRDVEFPIAASDVLAGDNTVVVKAVLDPGVPESLVYLDSVDLEYERLYRAEADELAFSAPGFAAVAVAGFSSAEVLLLDVTRPARPALVVGHSVLPAGDGTYTLQFGVARPDTGRYLALAPGRAKAPVAVTAWRSASLLDASNRADYVLIAPEFLTAAAQSLADYRAGSGVETLVVPLEAIYDTFNHGFAEPLAIRSFLRYATSRWSGPPRYATLVGRGTWDYRDRGGWGDNLVPPLLVGTANGLVASDVGLADLAGNDGVPEIAIGRLPVLTPQELLDYVAKVEAQEGAPGGPWQQRVLMVADNPDRAGNFTADSDGVAAIVPPGNVVDKVYLATTPPATARQAILDTLNSGALVFNYIGHGGVDRLADENILTNPDAALLTNAGRQPVFLAMTCSVGNFAIPGYPSLGETLLLQANGGAYAVWAPSWLSQNDLAVRLDRGFFQSVYVDGETVVGDAVKRGLAALTVPGSRDHRFMYNLLGEPVARLPSSP